MAYVPGNNVLQVELRGTQFSKEVENTLYFSRGDTIEVGEVNALFDWLEDVFIPEITPAQSNTFAWDELYGTDLTTASSPTYSRVFSPPIAGESMNVPEPNSVACCISFRTNGRGRGSRGRNYVGGNNANNVTNDSFELVLVNLLVAAYELLLGGGTFPSGWEWIVLSRFLDGAARSTGLIQPITDVLSTDLLVDSQRKRVK